MTQDSIHSMTRRAAYSRDYVTLRRLFGEYPEQARAACSKSSGRPVLFHAVDENDLNLIRILLEGGVDVNERNAQKNSTALMQAMQSADTVVIDALLAYKPDISLRDEDGRTALHYAARNGCRHGAKELVRAGCDINATDRWMQTPLYLAAEAGVADLTEFLLACNARKDIRNTLNKTARAVAAEMMSRRGFGAPLECFTRAAGKIERAATRGIAKPLPAARRIVLSKTGGKAP